MADTIPEPSDGTIVAWFDKNGDLVTALQRTDAYAETEERWYLPTSADEAGPFAWGQACSDNDGFRGPVVLVPADAAVSS